MIVLVFFGALCSEFLRARSNVIGGITVKSLEDTYHFSREAVPLGHKIQPTCGPNCFALLSKADQHEVEVLERFRGRGRGKGCGGGRSRGQRGEVIYCHIVRSQVTTYTIIHHCKGSNKNHLCALM